MSNLGDGSFASVILCTDLCPENPGRFVSEDKLAHLTIAEQESPEFEFNQGSPYTSFKESSEKSGREKAIDELKDLA